MLADLWVWLVCTPSPGLTTAGSLALGPDLRGLSPLSLMFWTNWNEVPDLPVAPQDEAGLTKTFQTWPRGWFHIP